MSRKRFVLFYYTPEAQAPAGPSERAPDSLIDVVTEDCHLNLRGAGAKHRARRARENLF